MKHRENPSSKESRGYVNKLINQSVEDLSWQDDTGLYNYKFVYLFERGSHLFLSFLIFFVYLFMYFILPAQENWLSSRLNIRNI